MVDGPLAVDVALVREAAETKKADEFRRGRCRLPAVSESGAANAFFKAATKLCGARLAVWS